jgi:hypothetical protein
MLMTAVFLFLMLVRSPVPSTGALPDDSDGDGLTDRFEQELLSRFIPKFLISAAANWQAIYWYGAAHEDTICDAGHGAQKPQ